MSKKNIIIVLALVVICASHIAHAAGPDCNPKYYADTQHLAACEKRAASYEQYEAAYVKYKALSDSFSNCTTAAIDAYSRALDAIAIMYPRFGIAYREWQQEMKEAQDAASAKMDAIETANKAAQDAAQKAFADAADAYGAAHPKATVLDVQAYAYNDPTYVAAKNAAKTSNDAVPDADIAAESQEKPAMEASRQRFTDRILRTAEPDAINLYNLLGLKLKREAQSCGPAPVMAESVPK